MIALILKFWGKVIPAPKFIMTACCIDQIFHTFRSGTSVVPVEITRQILRYIVANSQPMSFGGGVNAHRTHHLIAAVSRTLRLFYLDLPYSPTTNGRSNAPHHAKLIKSKCSLATCNIYLVASAQISPSSSTTAPYPARNGLYPTNEG